MNKHELRRKESGDGYQTSCGMAKGSWNSKLFVGLLVDEGRDLKSGGHFSDANDEFLTVDSWRDVVKRVL
jgi:hypothetical protein